MDSESKERWLWPSEVATILAVGTATIARWAKAGRLPHVRTLGGSRRYPESEVLELRERLTSGQENTP